MAGNDWTMPWSTRMALLYSISQIISLKSDLLSSKLSLIGARTAMVHYL